MAFQCKVCGSKFSLLTNDTIAALGTLGDVLSFIVYAKDLDGEEEEGCLKEHFERRHPEICKVQNNKEPHDTLDLECRSPFLALTSTAKDVVFYSRSFKSMCYDLKARYKRGKWTFSLVDEGKTPSPLEEIRALCLFARFVWYFSEDRREWTNTHLHSLHTYIKDVIQRNGDVFPLLLTFNLARPSSLLEKVELILEDYKRRCEKPQLQILLKKHYFLSQPNAQSYKTQKHFPIKHSPKRKRKRQDCYCEIKEYKKKNSNGIQMQVLSPRVFVEEKS